MTEIQHIKILDNKEVRIDKKDISIYKNKQLRCSGFEDCIDYLEHHCYFNDISDEDAFTILEGYQDYYIATVLQQAQETQEELTETLCSIQPLITDSKYRLKFFRKIYRDKRFRFNLPFWRIVFFVYFDLDEGKIGRLASRILLRANPNDRELWEYLTELYSDIRYRQAIAKKIINDIKKYNESKSELKE